MKRFDSIDVMRALAIMMMLPCHFILFWSPYRAPYEWVYTFFNDFLGGIGGPFFLFLVGTSYAVAELQGRIDSGVQIARKACAIFLIGVFLELSIEGQVFSWDALTLISFSIVLLHVLRKLPNSTLSITVAMIFLVSPMLRGFFGYLGAWSPEILPSDFAQYSPSLFLDPLAEYTRGADSDLFLVLQGFFVNGYFPVFPWVAFPLSGLVAGRVLYREKNEKLYHLPSIILGTLLTLVGFSVAAYAHYFVGGVGNFESGFLTTLSFFPLSPSWMLAEIGICLLSLNALRYLLDGESRPQLNLSFYQFLSKYSLTVYCLHYLIAYWPVRIAGFLSNHRTDYMGNLMEAPTAVFVAGLTMIGFYFLFMAWEKFNGKYSLGWMIKELSRHSSPPEGTVSSRPGPSITLAPPPSTTKNSIFYP